MPPNHFLKSRNLRFVTGGVATRHGTSLSISIPSGVRRWFPYSIEGQANRIIYLDGTGKIFDSLFPSSPILNIPSMVDFSLVVFNDRAYISPHNRVVGMAGEKVYVYQGSGLPARVAGGVAPIGPAIAVAQSPFVGSVEKGHHIFAVAYLTDTGFVTRPGAYISYIAPGGFQARLTNVPTGPAGTIARYILATKVIAEGTLDPFNQELFFIDGGKIEDNVGTSIDVSFFDADLLKSADYLIDQYETIPAFLGMATFAGSLVGWAPNTEPSMVYISISGEPESISLLEGGIDVDQTSGGGVKNCVEYRGQLMIHKSGRTYSTSSNGQEPVYWGKPIMIDHGIGTEVFGVAAILDEEGGSTDRYIISSKRGLIAYDGTFNNILTSKIDDLWKQINPLAFNSIQVVIDTINECIYATVPIGEVTSPNTILFGDYQKGLDGNNIRWSVWEFPYSPTTIGIDVNSQGRPVLKIGSLTADLMFLDPTVQGDLGANIPNPTFQTSLLGDSKIAVNQFQGVRVAITGRGNLKLRALGLDDTPLVDAPAITLAITPGKMMQKTFDIQSQYASFEFSTEGFGDYFLITNITIYENPVFFDEPA